MTLKLSLSARLYLLPVLLLLPLCWGLLAFDGAFLVRLGEVTPAATVVERQLAEQAGYGIALRDNRRRYKWELHKATRPDVVVVGSSRTQQFRALFFRDRFINLGGGFLRSDEGDSFVDGLLAAHRPRTLLLGLDHWWFDPRRAELSKRMSADALSEASPSLADLLVPMRWLAEGKITLGQYRDALFAPPPKPPRLGLLARFKGNYFRPDGSFAQIGAVTAAGATPIAIEGDPGLFPPNMPHVDLTMIERIKALVRRLEAAGVRVVLFLPPVSAEQERLYRDHADSFGYLSVVRREFSALGVPFFDFHDAATLGADDCEMVDAVHGGEVLAVRMLIRMAEDPRTGLAQNLDLDAARKAVARWSGHAVLWDGEPSRETDFLGLGCRKGGGG